MMNRSAKNAGMHGVSQSTIKVPTVSKTDSLKDLHIAIQCLEKELKGADEERVEAAQEAYEELLDDFYEEYQDLLISERYEAAKTNPEYLLKLIQLAHHYQSQTEGDSEGDESGPFFDWNLFTRI